MKGVAERAIALVLSIMALLLLALPVWADPGGRNTVFDGEYTLSAGQRLDDSLVVFGGTVRLERGSTVTGDVSILGGSTTLNGLVQGDVVVLGGTATLGASAVVEGDLVTLAPVERDPQAVVKGNTVESPNAAGALKALPRWLPGQLLPAPKPPAVATPRGRSPLALGGLARSLGLLIVIVVVAALTVRLMPEHLERMTSLMVSSPLMSAGVGLLTMVVLLVLLPILTITLIGIPVVIVLSLALLLCGLLAWVAAGRVVGRRLLRAVGSAPHAPQAETVVGALLLTFLAMIPCLGPLLAFALLSWGMGAVVLTRLGTAWYTSLSPFAGPSPSAPKGPAGPETKDEGPTVRRRGDTHKLPESPWDEAGHRPPARP